MWNIYLDNGAGVVTEADLKQGFMEVRPAVLGNRTIHSCHKRRYILIHLDYNRFFSMILEAMVVLEH